MPKDNENIPFLGPVEPSEPKGFSADQMIRCEECLRANPPTRASCLYCVAPLPLTETSARLIKPVLRPPEKHQLGYNNILLPHEQAVSDEVVADMAALLKLSAANVRACLSQGVALPVSGGPGRRPTRPGGRAGHAGARPSAGPGRRARAGRPAAGPGSRRSGRRRPRRGSGSG